MYRNFFSGELAQLSISEYHVKVIVFDHYQLATVGWEGDRRVFSCLIHIDIKGDKIWIQHDGTEVGVANQLIDLGIPKKSIDYFGLYWELGSASYIGRYGEISFYNGNTLLREFKSAHEVAEALNLPREVAEENGIYATWFQQDSYLNFFADPGETFDTVVLNATWWAQFESDNHAYRVATEQAPQSTSVPEPSSIFSVLGFGILGVGSAIKRKQQQKIKAIALSKLHQNI